MKPTKVPKARNWVAGHAWNRKGGAIPNKKKVINKKDKARKRLRSEECKSYRHIEDQCQDKSKEENEKDASG